MKIIPETDNMLQETIDFLEENPDIMQLFVRAIIKIQQEEIDKFRILEKQHKNVQTRKTEKP